MKPMRTLLLALVPFGSGPQVPEAPPPAAPVAAPVASPRPCPGTREYRQLDFWVGEWDVRPAANPQAPRSSRSRIERVEDQCVIAEHYETPTGFTGRSLNIYHLEKKRWEQFWVDNTGGVHHYLGQFRDGNLYYEAEDVPTAGPGSPLAKVKMTFFNQGPDEVRQLGEQSIDGGKTWTTSYDLVYRRRASVGNAS